MQRFLCRAAVLSILIASAARAADLRSDAGSALFAAPTERIELPDQGGVLERSIVASGPGWAQEQLAGNVGPLQLTDAADYLIVAGGQGIESVPLEDVVGAEFAGYVRGVMRANAALAKGPQEQVFVLQKSVLQAIEPLWIDRELLENDPTELLNRTICLPVPFVGADLAPSFVPDLVIRELTSGVFDYRELIGTDLAADLGPSLGSLDPRLSATALAQPVGAEPEPGAVMSAASSGAGGGLSCFNLRDLLLANGGDGICEFNPIDPSTWYSEPEARGTLDLIPPSKSVEISLDTTQEPGKTLLGDTYDGTLRYALDFEFKGESGRGIGGSLKVRAGLLFCVPLWLRPVQGRLWAHLEASREISMHGTLSVGTTESAQVTQGFDGNAALGREVVDGPAWGGQLGDPAKVFDWLHPTPALFKWVVFNIGPVPVLLILDAPIEIGLDASLETPMLTNFTTESGVRLGFDYACSFSGGCEAKEEAYVEPWSHVEFAGDAGFEGRALLRPYAGVSLRASLYFPGALYAKVGPRAFLNLDLWGASKTCGDANGDGSQEYVQGLALDSDMGIELIAKLGLYDPISDNAELNALIDLVAPLSFELYGWTFHQAFRNLQHPGGSTAFQPMLVGSTEVVEDQPLALTARMRPCYPYTDDVEYRVRWSQSSIESADGAPAAGVGVDHVYPDPGNPSVTLTAVSDAHGRNFGSADGDPLVTAVQRPVLVKAKPIVKISTPPIRLR
jgi:hypothetical protein